MTLQSVYISEKSAGMLCPQGAGQSKEIGDDIMALAFLMVIGGGVLRRECRKHDHWNQLNK